MKKSFWSLNKIIVTTGFIIFIFLLSIAVFNKKGILRTIDLGWKLNSMRSNIRQLDQENQMLIESIESYKSGKFQMEKIARESLGLAKENEVVIKIVKEKENK